MAGVLKELMRYSRKGYIDSAYDIKNILKRFSDLTLEEVGNMVDEDVQENVKHLAQAILNEEYGLEADYDTIKEFGFLELEIDCKSTMEDIFGQMEKIRNQSWSPGDTIEYYEERILNAYEILDCLLIEPFRYLYPEKFTMEYILGKYGSWFIGESCCG